jgi:hypothetical protein
LKDSIEFALSIMVPGLQQGAKRDKE